MPRISPKMLLMVVILPLALFWPGVASASPLSSWATSQGATENNALDSAAVKFATSELQGISPSNPVVPFGLYQMNSGISDNLADATVTLGTTPPCGSGCFIGTGVASNATETVVTVIWVNAPVVTTTTTVPVPVTTTTVPVPATTTTVATTTTTVPATTTTTVAVTTTTRGALTVHSAKDKSPSSKGPIERLLAIGGLVLGGGLALARKVASVR